MTCMWTCCTSWRPSSPVLISVRKPFVTSSWRIRSVLWAGVLYVVTIPLWLLFLVPGWIAWAVISIWFLYRVIRGWLALNDRRAMPE